MIDKPYCEKILNERSWLCPSGSYFIEKPVRSFFISNGQPVCAINTYTADKQFTNSLCGYGVRTYTGHYGEDGNGATPNVDVIGVEVLKTQLVKMVMPFTSMKCTLATRDSWGTIAEFKGYDNINNIYKLKIRHYKDAKFAVGKVLNLGDEMAAVWNDGGTHSMGKHVHVELTNLTLNKRVSFFGALGGLQKLTDLTAEPKPVVTLPKPVVRNEYANQVEVITGNLKCRQSPSTSGIVIEPGKYLQMGFYNILQVTNADGYNWVECEPNKWFATKDGWTITYPKKPTELEILKAQNELLKKQLETANGKLDSIDKIIHGV